MQALAGCYTATLTMMAAEKGSTGRYRAGS
ncbi:hypothetical protein NYV33_25465 [Escherichia coli]|nr:hypothetical protein [Escherichia coli]